LTGISRPVRVDGATRLRSIWENRYFPNVSRQFGRRGQGFDQVPDRRSLTRTAGIRRITGYGELDSD
jgi:hypothetical protein